MFLKCCWAQHWGAGRQDVVVESVRETGREQPETEGILGEGVNEESFKKEGHCNMLLEEQIQRELENLAELWVILVRKFLVE